MAELQLWGVFQFSWSSLRRIPLLESIRGKFNSMDGETTLVSKGLTVERNIEKRTRRSEELHPNILHWRLPCTQWPPSLWKFKTVRGLSSAGYPTRLSNLIVIWLWKGDQEPSGPPDWPKILRLNEKNSQKVTFQGKSSQGHEETTQEWLRDKSVNVLKSFRTLT